MQVDRQLRAKLLKEQLEHLKLGQALPVLIEALVSFCYLIQS